MLNNFFYWQLWTQLQASKISECENEINRATNHQKILTWEELRSSQWAGTSAPRRRVGWTRPEWRRPSSGGPASRRGSLPPSTQFKVLIKGWKGQKKSKRFIYTCESCYQVKGQEYGGYSDTSYILFNLMNISTNIWICYLNLLLPVIARREHWHTTRSLKCTGSRSDYKSRESVRRKFLRTLFYSNIKYTDHVIKQKHYHMQIPQSILAKSHERYLGRYVCLLNCLFY